jgi:hypothetical protein
LVVRDHLIEKAAPRVIVDSRQVEIDYLRARVIQLEAGRQRAAITVDCLRSLLEGYHSDKAAARVP